MMLGVRVVTGRKLADLTDAKAVTAAIEEFNRLGRQAFLAKYRFDPSREYFVYADGVGYDSKPIAAAAYGHQHGVRQALHFDDFSGGAPVIRAMTSLGFKVSKWTSPQLVEGEIYTRDMLRDQFAIEDATIKNGVFRPAGTNSIWLFVTRHKRKDRTQYEDRFEGGFLYWQGQTAGRTDAMIIGHEAAGDELLVFYRDSGRQYPGAGFRYEGRFRHVRHSGGKPTDFVLQRADALTDTEVPSTEFDPKSLGDGRQKIWAEVKRRQGQPKFRRDLIKAYEGRCAITGCAVLPLLEAAHIHPYRGDDTNDVRNGLLLRADIHTLFDLGLIIISEQLQVRTHPRLAGTEYTGFEGSTLSAPPDMATAPAAKALAWHRDTHAEQWQC